LIANNIPHHSRRGCSTMSSQFLENEQRTGRDKKNSLMTMLAAAPSDSWFIADVGRDRIELHQHPTVPSTNAVTLTSVICEYSCGLDIVRESVEEEPKWEVCSDVGPFDQQTNKRPPRVAR
jgi:hypothetical protein